MPSHADRTNPRRRRPDPSPDASHALSSLAAVRSLTSDAGRSLIDAVEHVLSDGVAGEYSARQLRDAVSPASLTTLRKLASAEQVAAAIDLVIARRMAAVKLGRRALAMHLDPEGVEQATAAHIGAYKAERMARCTPDALVLDLCCGVGGDAIAFTDAGLRTIAVDRSPARAWMAMHNVGCPAICADVAADDRWLQLDQPPAVHIDPQRRGGGRRTHRLDEIQPGQEVVRWWLSRARAGCVKLGPGVDPADAMALTPATSGAQLEFISDAGRLVQACLWVGRWADAGSDHAPVNTSADVAPQKNRDRIAAPHRAALLTLPNTSGDSRARADVIAGAPAPAPRWLTPGQPGDYLYEPDPAAERAQLLHVICAQAVSANAKESHPTTAATTDTPVLQSPSGQRAGATLGELYAGLGLLTSDQRIDSPWLTGFRVLATTSWRPTKLKQVLRELLAGVVEVKTRGRAVDPDQFQRQLAGDGRRRLTVFVLRMGADQRAIITQRLADADRAELR